MNWLSSICCTQAGQLQLLQRLPPTQQVRRSQASFRVESGVPGLVLGP